MQNKLSSFVKITSEDFAQYPYGFTYTSSVDGRGNFIVFAVFRKHGSKRREQKRLYSFVGLLCYCGGEFRDGFVQENITESEVLSLVQFYIKTAHSRIPFVKASADDVAVFIIRHSVEKSVKKKLLPQSTVIQKGVRLFRRAAKYSIYKNTNEYLIKKLGTSLKGPKFHCIDHRRREFQSWWMEESELKHNNLPLPPQLHSEPKFGDKSLWSYVQEINKTLNSEDNYERFANMSRHMGFWYLMSNKPENFKLAATMLMNFDRILECKRNGLRFSDENVLINLMVTQTQIMLTQLGVYENDNSRDLYLATNRKNCNMCGSPVLRGFADNDLTCVTREGEEYLGDESSRMVFAAICHDVENVGVPFKVVRQIHQVFSQAFYVFLTHCFKTHLYWKQVPSPVWTDTLAEHCSLHLLRILITDRNADWKNAIPRDMTSLMSNVCGTRLSSESMNLVVDHLRKTFSLLYICEFDQDGSRKISSGSKPKDHTMECKIMALKSFVIAPIIGNHLKLRWNFISERRKKRMLECEPEVINQALISIYRTTTSLVVEKLNALKSAISKKNDQEDDKNDNENMKKELCSDSECPCHLFSRFKDYFFMVVPIICDGDRSLLKWISNSNEQDDNVDEGEEEYTKEKEKKKPNFEDERNDFGGKLMIGHSSFLHNDNDILSDFIGGNSDDLITDSVELTCSLLPEYCPLLSILVATAYFKIYLAVVRKIAQQFVEVPLMEEEYSPVREGYYRPRCAGCSWEEGDDDVFLMCGGCREVYYCGKECQKLQWKKGHNIQCKKTVKNN